MQRVMAKQILGLVFLAFILVLVLGVIFVSHANAQGFLLSSRFDDDWDWDWDDDRWDNRRDFVVRYNRVEGLFLGAHLNRDYYRHRRPTRAFLYGSAGYAFKAKEMEYQIGLEKGFMDRFRLAFGAEYHRFIDTQDRWIISDSENSLAAVLIREDFHDFYLRDGASGYLVQNFGRNSSITVGYHVDSYDSLAKNTNWSLFGGSKNFRDNPAMDSGNMRSIISGLVFDTRNSMRRTTRGWFVQAEYEHAGGGLGGDFEFDRLVFDLRRYQSLGLGEGLDFRLRVGTSKGILPWQRSYHLGGISTLRGFPYKAYPNGRMNPGGNRMLLAQVEYRMGTQDLPDELDLGLLELFNLIIFADAGWVADVGGEADLFDGFDGLTWNDLKSDIGIALANSSGTVRVQIARRTDTGHKPFTFSFRVQRPF